MVPHLPAGASAVHGAEFGMSPLGNARPAPRLGRGLMLTALLVTLVATAIMAGQVARDRAAGNFGDRAAAALPLATAAQSGVIEKQRLIPLVLSRDPEVIATLALPTPLPGARLDAKLRDIADEAGSSVIYLIDAHGMAVAASNAGQPDSFVGSDYAFRGYFTKAMAEGTAAQYALGTVSKRPGLYLSRRVDGARGPLGVVVVKVEFDELETRWRDSGLVVHVTDGTGVVLTTSVPSWRFGATLPIADEAGTRAALQLDHGGLTPLPISPAGEGFARIDSGARPGLYATASGPVGPVAPGWTLTLFVPVGSALTFAERTAQITALLAGLLIWAGFTILSRRRRWAAARQSALAAMNLELERRVALRTRELDSSNAALKAEITERESAENRVRHLRDDLAQANRLSILGQIAAGVAHEINQPVAAIRTYAESGAQLLDAGDPAEARANFTTIVKVTERVGTITDMLRGFARRGHGAIRPVSVTESIDGALALLSGTIRDVGAQIDRDPVPPGLTVMAGRIRLEQILVNLLRNALDAVRGREAPRIAIRVLDAADTVTISVRDNGPGLDDQMRENLFMPFSTTKETGLGLGLVISADLAREFGGDLRLDAGASPGATFVLDLRRAS